MRLCLLRAKVTSDPTYGKVPIVIGGDFSDFLPSKITSGHESDIRRVAERELGFKDTWPAADNVRIGPNKTPWPTFDNDWSILDYIFVRAGKG